MELKLIRKTKTEVSTIGEFFINDIFHSFSLEDCERDGPKIHGKTCIPKGRYEVALSFSNKFKKILPLLIAVPGFAGIRIHTGNTAADTEGCILLGIQQSKDFVGQSKIAFDSFMIKLKAALEVEKVFITIE